MPSPSERTPGPLERGLAGAAALTLATLPPALLASWLKAEGPLPVLLLWNLLIVGGTALGVLLSEGRRRGSTAIRLGRTAKVLALLAAGVGLLVVLVQLNVARRSYAEAWMALARRGKAFGSFSFFVTELYALLCAGSSILILRGRPLAAASVFLSSTAFLRGILWGEPLPLALAVVLSLAVPLLAVPTPRPQRPQRPLRRLRSAAPPLLAAASLSIPFAWVDQLGSGGPLLRPFDLTPLVRLVAPTFPLLLDVPGYGYQIGGSDLAPSVYLSRGTLFEAESDGAGVRYLITAVYGDWTGSSWRESDVGGRPIEVQTAGGDRARPPGALRLRLVGDFYSLVPVERDTSMVQLSGPGNLPPVKTAGTAGGVRFVGSGERGLTADLLGERRGSAEDHRGQREDRERSGDRPEGPWIDPGPDPSGRLEALAEELEARGAKSGSSGKDRAVADTIRDYFQQGFAYTLSPGGQGGEAALEVFLFQEKRGYCLHFATAFVVLARRAGIPARVVEGFRVTLGEDGRGSVRGLDAHAWAEAWIDGAWRRYETTPPFAAADPFGFLVPGDSPARTQLEAIFGRKASQGREAGHQGKGRQGLLGGHPWVAILGPTLAVVVLVLFHLRRSRRRGDARGRAVRRRAARLVARSRALGVAGPEILGWTGWSGAVKETLLGKSGSRREREFFADAEEVAQELLRLAFGPPPLGWPGREKTKGAR